MALRFSFVFYQMTFVTRPLVHPLGHRKQRGNLSENINLMWIIRPAENEATLEYGNKATFSNSTIYLQWPIILQYFEILNKVTFAKIKRLWEILVKRLLLIRPFICNDQLFFPNSKFWIKRLFKAKFLKWRPTWIGLLSALPATAVGQSTSTLTLAN